MKLTEKNLGDLKDIIWFLKGFNKSDESPFNSEHTDSLFEAILFIQSELNKEEESVNEITK